MWDIPVPIEISNDYSWTTGADRVKHYGCSLSTLKTIVKLHVQLSIQETQIKVLVGP